MEKQQEKAVADVKALPNAPNSKSFAELFWPSQLLDRLARSTSPIMSFDFPRFTVVAGVLVGTTALFFLLWLSFLTDWLRPLVRAAR